MCCFRITNTFVFFGLSLNSVTVDGNIYVNFILVSLAEIPGYLITWLLMDRIGRKMCLFLSLVVSGIACIIFYFIPEGKMPLSLRVVKKTHAYISIFKSIKENFEYS